MKSPAEYHIEAIQKVSDMAVKSYEEENKILITLSFGAVGFLAHKLLNDGYNLWLVISFISFCICLLMLVIYYTVMRKNAIKAIKTMPTGALTFNADEFGAEIGNRLNNAMEKAQDIEAFQNEQASISEYIKEELDKLVPKVKNRILSTIMGFIWQFLKYGSFIVGLISAIAYVLVSINLIKI